MLDALTAPPAPDNTSDQRADVWARNLHQALAQSLQEAKLKGAAQDSACRHELKKLLKRSVDSTTLRNVLSYSPEKATPFADVINRARKSLLDMVQREFGMSPANQPLTKVLDEFSSKKSAAAAGIRAMGSRPGRPGGVTVKI